jgi:hypothetical protein
MNKKSTKERKLLKSPLTLEEFLAMHGLEGQKPIESSQELREFMGRHGLENIERIKRTVHNLYQKAYSVTDHDHLVKLRKSIEDAISHYTYAMYFDEADFVLAP